MTHRALLFLGSLFLMLTACSQISSTEKIKGVDASDDELLATLASLARRGTEAVCNTTVIESELGIKIGELTSDNTPFEPGIPRLYQWTDSIFSKLNGRIFGEAEYRRSRGNNSGSCQVWIRFKNTRLCDVSSVRIQKIMSAPLERSSTTPHRTDFGYIYKYSPATGYISEVYLGQSNSECSNQFKLTVIGEWK